MKHSKNFVISLMVVLSIVISLYFTACKKEIITPINNITDLTCDYSDYSDEAKLVAGKINKFKKQLVDKELVIRSGLNMPIDSVIWNVEALFNAEYTFPDRKYLETIKQELQFSLETNDDGDVSFSAVADLYEEITDAVRQAYSDDGINADKSLKAVVVDIVDIVGNLVSINVYTVSGRVDNCNTEKELLHGPFRPGDCWYYGEYGGTCDDPSVFGDAAEVIEDTINYYYSGTGVPRPGFRNLNFGMFRISLEGGEYLDANGEPYLYYYPLSDDPPLYLNHEMLNYYYSRELEVLLHLLPTDLVNQGVMPEIPAFIEVDIAGLYGYVGNGSYFHHKNYIIYGHKAAIPSQELPPLRDLLN